MKRSLTAKGRGRRVELERRTILNNKLLLQLDLLRKTCEKSWADMDSFFGTVCDPQHLDHTSLKLEIERASRGAAAVNSPDIEAFLDVDVGSELEIRNVGPFLQKLGIKRHHLLSSSLQVQDLPCAHVPVTNGTIMDLLIFQKDEGLPLQKEWYDFVGLEVSDLSDKQLRDRLKKTRQPYDSMSKHLSRPNITEKLRAFLFSSPSHFQLINGREQPSLSQTPDQPTITPSACTSSSIASACLGRQMAALRRTVEHVEGELAVSKIEQDTLHEIALERAVGLQQLETNLLSVEKERDTATGHLSHEKEKVLQLQQDDSDSAGLECQPCRSCHFEETECIPSLEKERQQIKTSVRTVKECSGEDYFIANQFANPENKGTEIRRRFESEEVVSDTEKQTDTGGGYLDIIFCY